MKTDRPERIQSPAAARILGVSLRTLQNLAARGEIPSAARIGQRWTYDEVVLRKMIRQKEDEATCQATFTNAAPSGGRGFSLPDVNIVEAYERAIGLRPKSGSPTASRR